MHSTDVPDTITTYNHDKLCKVLNNPIKGISIKYIGSTGSGVIMAFWSGKLGYFTRLLVYFIFFVAFVIQFVHLISNNIKPTITNTNMAEKELKYIGFPLVIKMCVRPGLNETAINKAGYKNSYEFFSGQSMYDG